MARKHEAVQWLREGNTPSQIAKRMGITVSTVMGYLYNQVGEGRIRRSDIVFAMDEATRDTIEDLIQKHGNDYFRIYQKTKKFGGSIDVEDLKVYLVLRDARVAYGDMYEAIRDIETALHAGIKRILAKEYGDEWWRKGIPESIRAECAESLERDPEPAADPFCYTNFIHLKGIIEKQWPVFSKALPRKVIADRKRLLEGLGRINQIRNSVMHPIKGKNPTDKDFAFVRDFRDHLQLGAWSK